MRRHGFLAGMIGAVVLATALPGAGRTGGPMHGDRVADAGIFAIFLLHGLGLDTARLKAGLLRWRLHAVVQAFTFCVFPVLYLALGATFGRFLPRPLLLGFFYLSVLPSTISSSVAMTGIARGNVPGAIFNAIASNVLGVFVTPLLVSLAGSASGGGRLPLARSILTIGVLILVPLAVGLALRPLLGGFYARHERQAHRLDKAVILVIVYVAFCDSVSSGLWSHHGPGVLALTLAGAAVLLALVLVLTTAVAGWVGLAKEDEIAAVFCGSKKALSSGVGMAKVLFGAQPGLGLIVLPVMCYHQLQLFACSVLAERYARRAAAAPPAVRT
ncbi:MULTISPECIES: bile acid:sodium symporter family protein [unclassified Anaeromyxobacter]|uniref:bile acid:sodium symporter family protein n=1 Tax=unclassified Anaeromyxobacter TaxID=2620896 RepID=UPI0021038D11|nr:MULTISPECIES: bile acid:sodium symporter family protein [unclassified Anaeromyxobacter]